MFFKKSLGEQELLALRLTQETLGKFASAMCPGSTPTLLALDCRLGEVGPLKTKSLVLSGLFTLKGYTLRYSFSFGISNFEHLERADASGQHMAYFLTFKIPGTSIAETEILAKAERPDCDQEWEIEILTDGWNEFIEKVQQHRNR